MGDQIDVSWDGLTTAVVASVILADEDEKEVLDDLRELSSLLHTLGVKVVGEVIQRRQKFSAHSLMGSGKVEEIHNLACDLEASAVVFDKPLTGPQIRNLEKMIGLPVLDRSAVILEIFSKHARTAQAKTQVEIARLEYLLPRLTGAWTHFQRQVGGGLKSRGMGEKQIEIDRRRARERITRLQAKLAQIQKDKKTQRRARGQEWKVALVGYTNTGKTTLMRNLTMSKVAGEDELFATLDTNIKVIDPRTRPKVLLSDTVGFIRNLPHALVESFRSTLQEAVEADLLLHVVDLSHPNYRQQIETTNNVLSELGADNVPCFYLFNKADRVKDDVLRRLVKAAYPKSIVLSAESRSDVGELRKRILDFFLGHMHKCELRVPADDSEGLSKVYGNCLVNDADYSEPGWVIFQVEVSEVSLKKVKKYYRQDRKQEKGKVYDSAH